MCDGRKWLLGRLLPKQFGDRVTQEITGDPYAPIVSRFELVPVDPIMRSVQPKELPAPLGSSLPGPSDGPYGRTRGSEANAHGFPRVIVWGVGVAGWMGDPLACTEGRIAVLTAANPRPRRAIQLLAVRGNLGLRGHGLGARLRC